MQAYIVWEFEMPIFVFQHSILNVFWFINMCELYLLQFLHWILMQTAPSTHEPICKQMVEVSKVNQWMDQQDNINKTWYLG